MEIFVKLNGGNGVIHRSVYLASLVGPEIFQEKIHFVTKIAFGTHDGLLYDFIFFAKYGFPDVFSRTACSHTVCG